MKKTLLTILILAASLTVKGADTDIKTLIARADGGNVPAMIEAGKAFEYGNGVKPDFEKAKKYLRMAADADNAEGQYELGNLLIEGIEADEDIIPPDYREGLQYLYLAHRNGHNDAANAIRFYCRGSYDDFGDWDLEPYMFMNNLSLYELRNARELLKSAAATSPSANVYLSVISDSEKDYSAAVDYLFKAYRLSLDSSGDWGDAEETDPVTGEEADPAMGVYICDFLGWHYEQGLGLAADYAKAIEWYEKADFRDPFLPTPGAAVGPMRVAQCHRKAKDGKYLEYLQGDFRNWPPMVLWQAEAYFKGDGVTADYAKATKLFEKVTEQGASWGLEPFKLYPSIYGDACYRLGQIYSAGLGVPRDAEMGQLYFDEALKYGSTSALADYFKTLDLK